MDVNEAIRWLRQAIARHERHMAGTEATDEASQQKMMDEMRKALAALAPAPPSATSVAGHPMG